MIGLFNRTMHLITVQSKSWFTKHKVKVLNWPAQSPELNPMENLWQLSLIEEIARAGHRVITRERLESLVSSMPPRCKPVIENRSWPTKY